MATLTPTRRSTRPQTEAPRPSTTKRKKEQRTDIWSSLLRQTREAQARSRSRTVQARELVLCGGTPEDQRHVVERYIARPPPPTPPGRNAREARERGKGGVVLSNQFAYGYGHVSLFSPPPSGQQGLGAFGAESEEVAKVEVHCVPDADASYESWLRRLLRAKKDGKEMGDDAGTDAADREEEAEEKRPAMCLLMSWKKPWTFLLQLRTWVQLLARALLPAETAHTADESPLDVLKEFRLHLTVLLQHTEEQETLLREQYTEESFDYISQCLRTCLLPLSAALVYTTSAPPPQVAGSPLSEVQKVLYTSLDLDVAALSTSVAGRVAKKEEFLPKHNVVDTVAIIVPSGWDSASKIRLLSESFSPEAVLEGWLADLNVPLLPRAQLPAQEEDTAKPELDQQETELQANGGAEVYSSDLQASSPVEPAFDSDLPMSPSKVPKSAVRSYEARIKDPYAHKAAKPPTIEITTKPEQEFLAEMRTQLQKYAASDAESARRMPRLLNNMPGKGGARGGRVNSDGQPGDAQAVEELGDVSFNVGGVSYNTVSAEAAIERLKRPTNPIASTDSPGMSPSRSGTPKPPRRAEGDAVHTPREMSTSSVGGNNGTPSTAETKEISFDKLEEYFQSLAKRAGGATSRGGTPSRAPAG